MKYLRQFCIILLISALGEGLHILLPLPVPASVYGLVLMLGNPDQWYFETGTGRRCSRFSG